MLNNRKTKVMVSPPRKQDRKPQGMARRSAAMIPRPPQLNNYEVTHTRTLRFVCSSAVNQNITFQNLLDTILMTTSATAPFDLFFNVKLRRVKAWALPALGSQSSISITFDGIAAGFVGDRKFHTDTSMGIEPAHVSCSPAPDTLAAKWQVSSSANAFNIIAPGGTVVDVDLSFRADAYGTAVAAQNASVGATIGIVAYRGLDGLPSATTKFGVPPGLVVI